MTTNLLRNDKKLNKTMIMVQDTIRAELLGKHVARRQNPINGGEWERLKLNVVLQSCRIR